MAKMKRIIIYSLIIVCLWTILAQCFILKNRISDSTAYKIFDKRGLSLKINDTLIANAKIHYAVIGNPSLPTLVFIHGSPGSWMNYMKFMWDCMLCWLMKVK